MGCIETETKTYSTCLWKRRGFPLPLSASSAPLSPSPLSPPPVHSPIIIRIFHGCEVRIEKSVRGSLFGTRLCRVMSNGDPEGRIFLSSPNNHDRFFFLHTFWPPSFDFNVGLVINVSSSYTLTPAILKVDVVYDVTMTSTPNVSRTDIRDLLYNQCIDNTCCYSFFICPTGRIRVCKTSFVSTGENRGKLCLVCKNIVIYGEDHSECQGHFPIKI